eukprot:1736626-Prymnesium_polylepis.1
MHLHANENDDTADNRESSLCSGRTYLARGAPFCERIFGLFDDAICKMQLAILNFQPAEKVHTRYVNGRRPLGQRDQMRLIGVRRSKLCSRLAKQLNLQQRDAWLQPCVRESAERLASLAAVLLSSRCGSRRCCAPPKVMLTGAVTAAPWSCCSRLLSSWPEAACSCVCGGGGEGGSGGGRSGGGSGGGGGADGGGCGGSAQRYAPQSVQSVPMVQKS